MSQKALSRFLKAIILMALAATAAVYLLLVPARAGEPGGGVPAALWVTLISLTAAPILASLVCAWLVARNIGLDRSCSRASARYLMVVSVLAAVDAGYYFLVSLTFFLLRSGEAVDLLVPAVLVTMMAAGSVAAAALSHLVMKAAALQEQSDLTI